ncbi:MAG: DUF2070 family protein [Nitrososphaerota archaeon]|nr:DUF2070 family protein [Nitrososphaerota archaeon]
MASGDSSRYIKFLLSFPSLRAIISINLLLEVTISILLLFNCPILRTIPQSLVLVFSPIPYSLFVYRIFIRDDEILTFRRLLALQSIQESIYATLVFLGFLVTPILPQVSCFITLLLISLGTTSSSFISMLVILGLLRREVIKVLVISFIHVFLQSSRWLILSLMLIKTWIIMMLPLAISLSANILFLLLVNHKRKIGIPIRPLDIFHAYLEYYFNKNPESFEKILEEASEKRDLELSLLLLSSKIGLSIFGLSAHFGPFGTIGSSPLPTHLIESLEKSDFKALLFRTLSNHSLDLPSRREVEKIRVKMTEALSTAKELGECRVSIVQKEAEGYCVTVISICSYCIILLSCPGHSTEDLPPEWLPKISSLVNHYGFTPIIISDAHNSIDSSSWEVSNPDYGRFAKLLGDALDCLSKTPQKKASFGFNKTRPLSLSNDEIGPLGISTLVFNIEGESHVLIVMDGNNMVMGLRNYLVDNLKSSLNLSTLEIITTDTHLLTGIKKAKKGYFPIGFKTKREVLLKICMESINSAIDSLSPCSVKVWIGKVEDTRVTGMLFTNLEFFVKYCYRIITILITSTILSTLLLSLIFS